MPSGECISKKIECLGCREGTARKKAKVIWELRHEHNVALLLDIAGLPRSTYYYYTRKQKKPDKYAGLKEELIDYLNYYNNRRIKAKLKGLTPAQHRYQVLRVA